MKTKILTLILALALVMSLFTLTACGDSDDEEDEESSSVESSTEYTDSEEEEEESDDEDSSKSKLSEAEIATFNDPITQYEGEKVLGSSVKSLISSLVANASTNFENPEKLPTVTLYDNSGDEITVEGGETAVDDIDSYESDLDELRIKLANTHNYSIDCSSTNSDGYVDEIVITY